MKIGVFFYKILAKKNISDGTHYDDDILSPILAIYETFQPIHICILYLPLKKDIENHSDRFKQGFECKGTTFLPIQGIRSFPEILNYPQKDMPIYLLPSVVSLVLSMNNLPILPSINFLEGNVSLKSKFHEPKTGDCQFFYDLTLDTTFLFSRLAKSYLFVMMNKGKIDQNEESLIASKIGCFYNIMN